MILLLLYFAVLLPLAINAEPTTHVFLGTETSSPDSLTIELSSEPTPTSDTILTSLISSTTSTSTTATTTTEDSITTEEDTTVQLTTTSTTTSLVSSTTTSLTTSSSSTTSTTTSTATALVPVLPPNPNTPHPVKLESGLGKAATAGIVCGIIFSAFIFIAEIVFFKFFYSGGLGNGFSSSFAYRA